MTIQSIYPNSVSVKPMLSVLAPVFNEASILEKSVAEIYDYMRCLEKEYNWELVLVNDGSKDDTAVIADRLAAEKDNMFVFHHKLNRNLGGALQTGFRHCKGDYLVVLDIDLSYAPEHIGRMLETAKVTEADIVVASPYMKGGKNTSVPFMRLLLSKTVNRLIRMTSPVNLHTFTGMVRLYKRDFLQTLNLKSNTYSINPEIIQKAGILRGRIVEIPAHLDWSFQEKAMTRTSSIRIFTGILSGLMTSFIFRPYAFFMLTGSVLLFIAIYVISWIFINTFSVYPDFIAEAVTVKQALTRSVAAVFRERPHSFFVGGTTLIIALQFLSLGFLSLQNKRYFDELFNLNSHVFKRSKIINKQ